MYTGCLQVMLGQWGLQFSVTRPLLPGDTRVIPLMYSGVPRDMLYNAPSASDQIAFPISKAPRKECFHFHLKNDEMNLFIAISEKHAKVALGKDVNMLAIGHLKAYKWT